MIRRALVAATVGLTARTAVADDTTARTRPLLLDDVAGASGAEVALGYGRIHERFSTSTTPVPTVVVDLDAQQRLAPGLALFGRASVIYRGQPADLDVTRWHLGPFTLGVRHTWAPRPALRAAVAASISLPGPHPGGEGAAVIAAAHALRADDSWYPAGDGGGRVAGELRWVAPGWFAQGHVAVTATPSDDGAVVAARFGAALGVRVTAGAAVTAEVATRTVRGRLDCHLCSGDPLDDRIVAGLGARAARGRVTVGVVVAVVAEGADENALADPITATATLGARW